MKSTDIPLLLYTAVEQSNHVLYVSPTDFKRHMQLLKREERTFLSLNQLSAFVSGAQIDPGVVVAFSEARNSFLSVLDNIEGPVALFFNLSHVGKDEYLSWEELQQLPERVTLGVQLGTLTEEVLSVLPKLLARIPFSVSHCLYHLQDYSNSHLQDRVISSLREQGFVTGITLRQLSANSYAHPLALPCRSVVRSTHPGKLKDLLSVPTISVCMIVKNEALCLPMCLSSVRSIADELIMVDTGSTDATKDIVRSFGATVIDWVWKDDFSAARNVSLQHATSDWILVLDADEIIEQTDLIAIKGLVELDYDAFTLILKNYSHNKTDVGFVAKPAYGFPGYLPVPNIRLFRNGKGFSYSGKVHESVDLSVHEAQGKVGNTDVAIHHLELRKGGDVVKQKQLRYLEYSKQKLAHTRDIKTLCDVGLLLMQFTNDLSMAEKYLQEAKLLDKKHYRPYLLLGQLYVQKKEHKKAERIYEEGVERVTDEEKKSVLAANYERIVASH